MVTSHVATLLDHLNRSLSAPRAIETAVRNRSASSPPASPREGTCCSTTTR